MANQDWTLQGVEVPSLLPLQPPPQNEEQVVPYIQALHNYLRDDRNKIARAIQIINYFKVITGTTEKFEDQVPQNSKTQRTNEDTLEIEIDTAVPTGTAEWHKIQTAAENVKLDTTDFDGILSATEEDLQAALDVLDDHLHPQYPDKTGWASPADSLVTMAFNDGTREFTLTPTGASFEYWIQGVKYTKTTPQTVTIDDTHGLWFIYFAGDTLTASMTPWGIVADDKAFVAGVYWDADANEAIRVEYEMHGWQMDASTHQYLHETFGTRWESGLAVGINGDNLDVTAGELHDEDNQINITDSAGSGFWEQDLTPASLPILYRSGASGVWKRIAASTTPCYLDTNVLQINTYSGGLWGWAAVTNNRYCAYWVVASADINEPVFLVPGQEDGATLSAARDGNLLADMQFGSLPSAEHKVVARVIVKRVGGSPYYELEEVADYRNVSDEPSGTAALIGDHGALTGLTDPDHPATAVTVDTTAFAGILSGADTLVQSALDTIDDHDHDSDYSALGHGHTESDISDLGDYLDESAADALYSALGHSHTESDITDLDHTDDDAFHNDVASEILGLASAGTLGQYDQFLLEDVSASYAKRRAGLVNLCNFGDNGGPGNYLYCSNDSGGAMAKGDICYISGDASGVPRITKADADAASTGTGMLVMCTSAIASGSDGWVIAVGTVSGFSSLTAGAVQYLSTTAAGRTQTAPSGSGDIVRVIGHAISTTEIYFNPSNSWVEVA